ncbi:MAG: Uma2 family endonuclease [Pirellulales bacterium]
MAASVIFEDHVEIPLDVGSFGAFRRWALSDAFPQQGRIDFVGGRIEVDMSPEELFSHGTLKTVLVSKLFSRIERDDLGHLFTDSTRVSHPASGLSVEPDVVFISHEAIDTGRVRLVPKAGGEPGRYVEVEGPPDLIIEIVSDASVTKDTQRLPRAYAESGVPEFWLADARHEPLVFEIHHLVDGTYHRAVADREGYQASRVFNCHFRLDAQRDARGHWKFNLIDRPER